MDTASFSGFLKTIFWLFLIYYALKFLFRLLAPILVNKVVQKAERNFQERARDFYNQSTNNHQSETSYQNKTTSKSEFNVNDLREKKKVGEYIDFEEIEK